MRQTPFGIPPDAQTSEALEQKATIDYKSELVRKGIHLCSLAIPVIYYFIPQRLALTILIPLAGSFLVADLARHFYPAIARWYSRWFGWLLRQHERDSSARRLNGATNILLSAVVCVALFPKIITVNAFAILIVSDTTSALIGRRFGRRPFLNKSLEGTLAFFFSAVIVVFAAPKVLGIPEEYSLWLAAAAAGAIAEAWITGVDDNISVPLTIGLVAWGLYRLFLSEVNLFFLM